MVRREWQCLLSLGGLTLLGGGGDICKERTVIMSRAILEIHLYKVFFNTDEIYYCQLKYKFIIFSLLLNLCTTYIIYSSCHNKYEVFFYPLKNEYAILN